MRRNAYSRNEEVGLVLGNSGNQSLASPKVVSNQVSYNPSVDSIAPMEPLSSGTARSISIDRMMANIEGLTAQQINAFKEVFDLFDSNGGGTIDAEELDQALRSVDIQLTKEEIIEVLQSMDKDGNGEIDFEEFLQLMTNTERFLESITCRDMKMTKQKEVLLFEALTAFMKKSALHSINEIVGYYHSKYKRAQAPHVVGHYAAGARLIGLTERQIKRHMEQLREINTDTSSPYAQPLLRSFYSLNDDRRVKNKMMNRAKKKAAVATVETPQHPNVPTKEIEDNFEEDEHKACGKIRLRILPFNESIPNKMEHTARQRGSVFDGRHHAKSTLHIDTMSERVRLAPKQNGWMAQRIRPAEVKLPSLNQEIIGMIRSSKPKRSGKLIDLLNFDDMRTIRKEVGYLNRNYYAKIQQEKRQGASEHWHLLSIGDTASPILRQSFRKAFTAYTNYHTTPVLSLTI